VVSTADPLRSLISVFYTRAATFLSSSSSFILTRAEWTPFQNHCYSENLTAPGLKPGNSGSAARTSGVSAELWCVVPCITHTAARSVRSLHTWFHTQFLEGYSPVPYVHSERSGIKPSPFGPCAARRSRSLGGACRPGRIDPSSSLYEIS
jgi:hypothetical protein